MAQAEKYKSDLSDEELAAHLLAHPTVGDKAWKSRAGRKTRKTGETRRAFIHRAFNLEDPEAASDDE